MKEVKKIVLAGLVCMLFSCNAIKQTKYSPFKKIAPEKLRSDLVLLKKILEANHPSLYWYTPKDSIDWYFNTALNSITDSLNEIQFKNKLAWVVSNIHCGHTTVRFSKAYGKVADQYRFPQFPISIKAWDDSLVVLSSANAAFKRGTIITSINGRSNRELLDTFFKFMSMDGYGVNYKNQVVSLNFPAWYKTILGLDSQYVVTYIDSNGKAATKTVKNFIPRRPVRKPTDSIVTQAPPVQQQTAKERRQIALLNKRALGIDTSLNLAFFRITTFTGGGLKTFFRRSFKTIRKKHIENVVIDLRENGGGNVSNSIRLSEYLVKHAFKVGDSVVAKSRKFEYGRYINNAWLYWFPMNFAAHKEEDGLIHFRHYEKHFYQPSDKNHFDGKVYIIQGGLTFSASTMFISTLKGQDNVKVVGEESGGGYYGNSAMHIPTIVLPQTGIQVSLPMYRLVMDAKRPKGRGIIPDIEIKPSSQAIKEGIDLKILKIREAIQQKTF